MYPGGNNYSGGGYYNSNSQSPPKMHFPGDEDQNNQQNYYNNNSQYASGEYNQPDFTQDEQSSRAYPGDDYRKKNKKDKLQQDAGYSNNNYQNQDYSQQNNYQGGGFSDNNYQQGGYPNNDYQQGGYNNYNQQQGEYNNYNQPQGGYNNYNQPQGGYPANNYQGGSYPEHPTMPRSNTYENSQNHNNGQNSYNQNYQQPHSNNNSNNQYSASAYNDSSMAPPANMPYAAVDYGQINYNGMEFPEFSTAPVQSQGSYNQQQNIVNDSNLDPQFSQVQLSSCEGRKRALLIGINYTGSKFRLRGCINDVHRMKKFLSDHFNFKDTDMVLLTDDQKNSNRLPTRANILKAMKWLVHDAAANDSFFFHYSGHGSRVEDLDGDEIDGEDETICPLDFEENGQIIDDDMNAIMVRPLPQGCRLTAIFDCCHSGSALDLPFTYSSQGKLKHSTALDLTGASLKNVGQSYLKGDVQGALQGLMSSVKILTSGDSKLEQQKREKSSAGDVIMLSGCKDTQTSADAKEDLNFTGAMSWAFTNSLYEKPQQTYIALLNDIRDRLKGKYTQIPQLSSGRLMDMETVFIM
ncbi:hypothetical protein BB561_001514 [Smittium simulii]|uniref:Peptidase C14 caspase domain-containing protein n=1 Tax=Smittium simulii TaxID=133385 RepID=A0A2T9YUE2_9FUNG|nr:hypothetical protein BB561_001514 [Smittium simulii]